ncbi:hypothetical protein GCM10011497_06910 [Elstera cyanobacteriorum]|uniref:Uncharacterized protein n=2 Tax=Elstera cyanobacteriorum TaxID=2022747 RepID=A0A255XVD9_9PROT|nr:hypothetical protein CHR90_05695 [Elstera cyanobacteriorum]GFZ80995.1 hypothetical protein GCM10011497_06910 [Elstera cyanobacteriorum]
MTLKFGYSVNNLRSIKDMDLVDFKKITILVGKNSAGKSSFLRSLWLIKRSLSNRSGAPVMWYGGRDDDVDFGDFNSSKNRHTSEDVIKFNFRIGEIKANPKRGAFFPNKYIEDTFIKWLWSIDVSMKAHIGESDGKTVKRKIVFSFNYIDGRKKDLTLQYRKSAHTEENNAIAALENLQLKDVVTGKSMEFRDDNANFIDISDTLLPKLLPVYIRNNQPGITSSFYARAEEQVKDFVRLNAHGNVNDVSEVVSSLLPLLVNPDLNVNHINSLLENSKQKEWVRNCYLKIIKKGDVSIERFKKIGAELLSCLLIEKYSDNLFNIINHTVMIGPLRANPVRFYRVYDLQTSSIESDGSNLAMWLNSLSKRELEKFSDFIKSIFGFGVDLQRKESNVSIVVIKNDVKVNIVDTGFGISQILPILSLIWLSRYPKVDPRGLGIRGLITPVLVEQPELHLHPGYQAKLADAFVEASKSEANDVRFLIETHSEALINRFGDLVVDGRIDPDDIQIIIFDDSDEDGEKSSGVNITTAKFDRKGRLLDWPFGFFNR